MTKKYLTKGSEIKWNFVEKVSSLWLLALRSLCCCCTLRAPNKRAQSRTMRAFWRANDLHLNKILITGRRGQANVQTSRYNSELILGNFPIYGFLCFALQCFSSRANWIVNRDLNIWCYQRDRHCMMWDFTWKCFSFRAPGAWPQIQQSKYDIALYQMQSSAQREQKVCLSSLSQLSGKLFYYSFFCRAIFNYDFKF